MNSNKSSGQIRRPFKKNVVKSKKKDHKEGLKRRASADQDTCISTNQSKNMVNSTPRGTTDSPIQQLSGKSLPHVSTKKHAHIPDKNSKDSIKKLFDKCDQYQGKVRKSYSKRKFTGSQINDFDTLLGVGKKFSDHLPASDMVVRKRFGKYLIKSVKQIWKEQEANKSTNFYFITFIHDEFLISERTGEAEVWRLKEKVQHILRTYSDLSALSIVELQPITNYPKGTEGGSLSLHVHTIAWGPTVLKKQTLSKRAKGFKARLTRIPILSLPISTINDLTTIARYIAKPPIKGKYVDYRKLELGKPCLNQISLEKIEACRHLRLFEYLAKTPIEVTLFGTRDGARYRREIVSKLNSWHKSRRSERVLLGGKVDQLFSEFLSNNKRLKNFNPIRVKSRR
jgi:hypothetical protein